MRNAPDALEARGGTGPGAARSPWRRLRLERRSEPALLAEATVLLLAVALSCGVAALLFWLCGAPPLRALLALAAEPFGSAYGFSETLVKTVPLAFCALAVALGLKIGLWNIGAEGQLFMGAFGATLAALHLPAVPEVARVPVLLAAGALAGALWATGPGLLKVWGGVSEIISTLMLNYVAIAWVEYLVFGPWKGADGFPYTAFFDPGWRLPLLFGRVHAGIVLAVVLTLVLWAIERGTTLGYEVRVAGASPENARYGGMAVLSRLLLVMAAAGGCAGLAGACVVSGVEHRLHAGVSAGYGYTAIIVAFLARRSLPGSVVVAFLFAALAVGGDGLQVAFPEVGSAIVRVLQGFLLVAVLSGGALAGYRVRVGGPAAGRAEPVGPRVDGLHGRDA